MLHAFDFYTENAAKALSIEGLTELGQHCPDSEELVLTRSFDLSLLGSADQVLFPELSEIVAVGARKVDHASPDLYAATLYHHTPQLDVVWGFDLCRDKGEFEQAIIEELGFLRFVLLASLSQGAIRHVRSVMFDMTENQRCDRINILPSERVSDQAELSD